MVERGSAIALAMRLWVHGEEPPAGSGWVQVDLEGQGGLEKEVADKVRWAAGLCGRAQAGTEGGEIWFGVKSVWGRSVWESLGRIGVTGHRRAPEGCRRCCEWCVPKHEADVREGRRAQ